jgi:hypothetical protein
MEHSMSPPPPPPPPPRGFFMRPPPTRPPQAREVRRVIREMRSAARRLGPCATSSWLNAAAESASRELCRWESQELTSLPPQSEMPA